ncbi:alpha/beta hydrolase [Rhodopirellula sp. P2]|uniref:alpha/beta hydrolase n=1 Tax=Rhodopirellula sp. P2 TaxID=2127060 RepID=UPI002368F2A6|nr:esterase [Rhodopirellula sp. P2]WDQ14940.1 esterase [Rhodopirellula sp. P2]
MRYLALLLFLTSLGCSEPVVSRSDVLDNTSGSTAVNESDPPWGGLKIQSSGISLDDADQIVVLLHGYGATDADLTPLAEYIGGDKRAFVFPAAPIPVDGGGLAWATTEQELETAHARLASLVRFASRTYPDAEIAVGGFSQGATVSSMLLSDASLPIRHLILYSPALAIDAESLGPARNIQVLLAHGRGDQVLPFDDAKRLHEMLERKGVVTNWHPFNDGHTITTEVLDATRDQLSQEGG